MRKGWKTSPLDDVCSFQNGFAFKSNTFKDTGTPVVRITNIKNDRVDISKIVFIDESDYDKNLSRYEIIHGDLLIAMSGATTGKIGINYNKSKLLLNQRVGKFIPSRSLEKQFLFYYLSAKVEENLAISAGAAQPNLSTEQIKSFPIPVPPLAEQEAIVEILDKAFTAIDQAKANIEQNIANAKELFQSKLNQIFSQKGEGWVEKTLGQIASLKYGITLKSTSDGNLRYVRITDIDNNGHLTNNNKKYVPESAATADYLLKPYDLVMARTGATFAKTLLYNGEEPSVYASYLIKIDFIKDIENELYWYFTKTEFYWTQANSLATGAAQPHFNGGALKQVVFNYPESPVTQKNIILLARELESHYDSLYLIYQTKLASLEELKKSILQKAFAGDLT